MNTLYDILGISENASTEEIKKAYRKLSIKFHPDKNEVDPYFLQMFRQINEAYNVLLNPEERRKYDFQLRDQSNLKSHAERLKKLEEELAYKNSLLRKNNGNNTSNHSTQQSTLHYTEQSNDNFPIKIKHIKYFLWIIIVGLIIGIGSKANDKPEKLTKRFSYAKSLKRIKKKRLKKLSSQIKKEDTLSKSNVIPEVDSNLNMSIKATEDTLKN
ncbi:J domain-containing protein [Pedobacter sp. GSP4]|uniref:J domain-containing protein n=1 Tax=Pedobacter sp. GSP4 TaxID=3453716 RepID=UPI003EEF6F72